MCGNFFCQRFVQLFEFLATKGILIASFGGSHHLWSHRLVIDNHCCKRCFVPTFCGVVTELDNTLVCIALGGPVRKAIET